MDWTLAVDFGTTSTAATYCVAGESPQRVRLGATTDAMPSAVLAGPHGIQVGSSATHSRRVYPDCFLADPKGALGRESIELGGSEHEVVDLVGRVLARVAAAAARCTSDEAPSRVVLTHPEAWRANRRWSLEQAWERAGVAAREVVLVPEPVAAATWLASRTSAQLRDGAVVGVLDYGGGTCDIAILRDTGRPQQPWQVLASGGSPKVGGSRIDALLLAWVRETLHQNGQGDLEVALDAPQNLGALRTLHEEVRAAKETLSDADQVDIPVAVAGASTWVSITVEEFELEVAGEMARVRAVAERVIAEAGLERGGLDRLFLTGGSSLMRPVSTSIADLLVARPVTLDDPKLVVALGAHAAAHTALTGLEAVSPVAPVRPARRVARTAAPATPAAAPSPVPLPSPAPEALRPVQPEVAGTGVSPALPASRSEAPAGGPTGSGAGRGAARRVFGWVSLCLLPAALAGCLSMWADGDVIDGDDGAYAGVSFVLALAGLAVLAVLAARAARTGLRSRAVLGVVGLGATSYLGGFMTWGTIAYAHVGDAMRGLGMPLSVVLVGALLCLAFRRPLERGMATEPLSEEVVPA